MVRKRTLEQMERFQKAQPAITEVEIEEPLAQPPGVEIDTDNILLANRLPLPPSVEIDNVPRSLVTTVNSNCEDPKRDLKAKYIEA